VKKERSERVKDKYLIRQPQRTTCAALLSWARWGKFCLDHFFITQLSSHNNGKIVPSLTFELVILGFMIRVLAPIRAYSP
jgi:hypothetical protein